MKQKKKNEGCTGRERELTLIEVAETADGTGVGEGVDDAVVKEIGSLSWEQEKRKKRHPSVHISVYFIFHCVQWTTVDGIKIYHTKSQRNWP